MINTKITNGDTHKISKIYRVTGTGAITANILQLTGCVRIIDQYAIIRSVTTLTNATNVYATAYDGTNSENLTKDGATISNYVAGSMLLKDKAVTETYTTLNADQVRVNEQSNLNKNGKPFTVVQKNNTNTFLRLHLTTTDNPIDFQIEVFFEYMCHGPDSNLVFL